MDLSDAADLISQRYRVTAFLRLYFQEINFKKSMGVGTSYLAD